jgi:hypothetical protein
MRPIWFDGGQDMQCFYNFIKETKWSLNFNYWTGGTREEKCSWKWCHGNSLRNGTGSLTWASEQPDNVNGSEACLHLKIATNGTGPELFDKKCASKFIMACKVLPAIIKNSASNYRLIISERI